MILIVLLVLALFVVQTFLPNRFREPAAPGSPGVAAETLGNRDHMRPHTVVGLRALRALANLHEAMPVFIALALMNMIVGSSAASLAVTGATVFLVARIVYVPLYLAGVPVARSLAWGVGFAGLIAMAVPLIERI